MVVSANFTYFSKFTVILSTFWRMLCLWFEFFIICFNQVSVVINFVINACNNNLTQFLCEFHFVYILFKNRVTDSIQNDYTKTKWILYRFYDGHPANRWSKRRYNNKFRAHNCCFMVVYLIVWKKRICLLAYCVVSSF